MYKVAVTIKIPEAGLSLLQKKRSVKLRLSKSKHALKRTKLLKFIKGADGVITWVEDKVDTRFFKAAGEDLLIVASYTADYNNIDVEEATRRGVLVTNTPGIDSDTVADLTMSLMLAVSRKVIEADNFIRAGKFGGWEPRLFLGKDVYRKTLGIVGMGRIGYAVAKRAHLGFGMRILYYDTLGNIRKVERELKAKHVKLENLLRDSDFVSLHVPLSEVTFHLVGTREFKLMKKSSFLINTAGGSVVDERALVKALRNQEIAGAALDVFEHEPILAQGLKGIKNVVLTPHIGGSSKTTCDKMSIRAAKNIIAALENKKPPNLVNKEAW